MISKNIYRSFLHASGVIVYLSFLAWLLPQFEGIPEPQYLMPVLALTLFIISACVTASLVLGKPILLFWGGQKKEAITLFFSTMVWLVIFLIVIAAVVINK